VRDREKITQEIAKRSGSIYKRDEWIGREEKRALSTPAF